MPRGYLSEELKELMIKEGFEGHKVELRLLPYMMVTLLDNSYLDIRKLSGDEMSYIVNWAYNGFIKNQYTKLEVTEEFFDKMVKILKEGYLSDVLIKEKGNENSISGVLSQV